MRDKLRKTETIFRLLVVGADVLFVTAAFFSKWPAWWQGIIPENSPLTWFESVILFGCSGLALLNAFLYHLENNRNHTAVWSLLSLGFLFLCLDERFAVHERIREGFLKPFGIKCPVFFWTAPGDYILLIWLVLGLALLPFLWRVLKENPRALKLFLIAVGVSALAVALDSFEIKNHSLLIQRIEQTVEEILETIGMTLFLLSFFNAFTAGLARLGDRH